MKTGSVILLFSLFFSVCFYASAEAPFNGTGEHRTTILESQYGITSYINGKDPPRPEHKRQPYINGKDGPRSTQPRNNPRVWEVSLNKTEEHISRTAVADGELGVARSSVNFDRRPTYVNGKDEPGSVRGKMDPPLDVTETQHTVCQINTEQLVATATATVTRVLKGLCTSSELEKRFQEWEGLLTDRLNELKDVIHNLEYKVDDYNEALRRGKFQQVETQTIPNKCETPKSTMGLNYTPDTGGIFVADENDVEEKGPRESEIRKYNSSIYMENSHNGPPKKVFSYYWKINEMNSKLSDMDPRRSIRSPSFYLYPGGYRLYLRSYPRQNETNFFLHVGVTKGDFDEALKWPFPLKMRVNVLDQSDSSRIFDIYSRLWDPSLLCSEYNWQKPTRGDNSECVGLGLPHDMLFDRKYIFADTLVAKLNVYLDPL